MYRWLGTNQQAAAAAVQVTFLYLLSDMYDTFIFTYLLTSRGRHKEKPGYGCCESIRWEVFCKVMYRPQCKDIQWFNFHLLCVLPFV